MESRDTGSSAFRRPITLLLLSGFLLGALAGCSDESATGPSAGPKPGIRFVRLSMPVDLTPDGSIAAIQDGSSPAGDLYFYHTATGALELKTQVGDPLRTFASAISANGVVTALHNEPVQAGFWTAASEWTDLTTPYLNGCGADYAGAWDVSANGHVIVGLVWNGCAAEAFRWDAGGSGIMTPLQLLGESFPGSSNPPANRATVISDDGSTTAGWAQTSLVDRSPAIWKADGTGFLLTGFTPDAPGEVLSISADGKMVAGTWADSAFYWTSSTGVVNMGKLPNDGSFVGGTYANAIAAGGKLIFGTDGSPFFTLPRAFAWSASGGMQQLDSLAVAHGITIPDGYFLTHVQAASADGSVVLGVAYDANFNQVTFVLTLPVSAYGL
jgi:hypothetical protein